MKSKKKPFEKHIKKSNDLVTTYEATRAGFVALALEKNRKATPFVSEAKALKAEALTVSEPKELLSLKTIQSSILTAAGISDKAEKYLTAKDKEDAIKGLVALMSGSTLTTRSPASIVFSEVEKNLYLLFVPPS